MLKPDMNHKQMEDYSKYSESNLMHTLCRIFVVSMVNHDIEKVRVK